MVEWSIAAVLKTVERQLSGGSNPSLCAKHIRFCSIKTVYKFASHSSFGVLFCQNKLYRFIPYIVFWRSRKNSEFDKTFM